MLPRSERARAEIYDLMGRSTRVLDTGRAVPPGEHVLRWDGRDASGAPAAPGIYLVRLTAGAESGGVKRIVLLR